MLVDVALVLVAWKEGVEKLGGERSSYTGLNLAICEMLATTLLRRTEEEQSLAKVGYIRIS
jgi:hypothetical protein